MKLWDKGLRTEATIERFTIGQDLSFDAILAPYDVQGSIAHVSMLSAVGLISKEEHHLLMPVLQALKQTFQENDFKIPVNFEDIHSYLEFCLIEKLGDVGKKVHTARSRNDQVLTCIKLYFKDVVLDFISQLKSMSTELCERADKYKDYFLPGYTHLQMAMPSSFGLWFSAYAEAFAEDIYMLRAALKMCDQNPLGSAAGYGSSFPIDRELTAKLLNFSGMHINSVSAQMARGKTEFMLASAMASVAMTINKFASDVCLFNSQHFNFIQLPPELCTGSSIMPHKNNPDVFELMRGRSNRIMNCPAEITRICTNLPSGYHRDFQLLKEATFPQIQSLKATLDILQYSLPKLKPKKLNPNHDAYKLLYTVDAINALIQNGTAFRDAYNTVGKAALDGTFEVEHQFTHTHIGSKDALGIDRILVKINEA